MKVTVTRIDIITETTKRYEIHDPEAVDADEAADLSFMPIPIASGMKESTTHL